MISDCKISTSRTGEAVYIFHKRKSCAFVRHVDGSLGLTAVPGARAAGCVSAGWRHKASALPDLISGEPAVTRSHHSTPEPGTRATARGDEREREYGQLRLYQLFPQTLLEIFHFTWHLSVPTQIADGIHFNMTFKPKQPRQLSRIGNLQLGHHI